MTSDKEENNQNDPLYETENRYRTLFEMSPVGIGLTDPGGIMIDANQMLAALFGCTIDELSGIMITDLFVDPKDGESIRRRLEKHGNVDGYETSLKRRDGTEFRAAVSMRRITLHGEDGIQTVITRISDDTARTSSLDREQEAYIKLLDDSPLPFLVTGLNRKFKYANKAAIALFGYTGMEDFTRNPIRSRYSSESLEEIEAWWQALQNGMPNYMTGLVYEIVTTSGERRLVRIFNKPCIWDGEPAQELIYLDVTEQTKAAKQLQETEERLHLHFDYSPLGVIERDSNFIVTRWTGEAETIFGWKADEVLGKTLMDLNIVYHEDIPLVKAIMERMERGDEPYIVSHNRNYAKDGRVLHCSWYTSVIKDDQNNLRSILSFVLDMTERYRIDTERMALNGASRSVLASNDFPSASRQIFDYCREVTGATSGYIALLDQKTGNNDLLFLEAGGMPCSVDPSLPMPVRGLRAEAYRTKQTICENEFPETEWEGLLPEGHVRLNNVLFAPLVIEDTAVGVIGLANKPSDFDEHDVRIMNSFAEICSIALVNSRYLEVIETSEEKYRLLFESVSEGFALHEMIYDSDGNAIDYRYLEVNPAFLRQSGYSEIDVIGKTVREITPVIEGDPGEWIERYEQVIATGEPYRYEQYSYNLGRWFAGSAFRTKPGQFAILFQDITEQKEARETIEIEATRRKILIDQSRDGIVVLTSVGRVYEANRRFAEMLGYEPEEMNKLSVYDWEYRYPHNQLLESFESLDETGNQFETVHRRKDGSLFDVEISVNAASISGEKYIFCVCRDISARKQMEQSLRDAEDRFIESVENSPVCIHIYDKDGSLLFINKAGLTLRGFSSMEEFIHTPAEKRMTPESFVQRNLWEKDRLAGIPLPAQYRIDIIRPDGKIVNLECFRSEVYWQGENREQVLSVDITSRIMAQEQNKASIENSPLSIWMFDQNGTLTYLNKRALEVTGYDSVPEFLAVPRKDRVTAESYAQILRWSEDEAAGRQLPVKFTLDLVRKDGTERNLRGIRNEIVWNGQPHSQIIYEDITEQVVLEKSLRVSEERFRELFENMSLGVAVYETVNDGEDFVFIGFNKSAETFERISRSEVLGKRVSEVFPGIREFGLFAVFQRVWRTGVSESHPTSEYKDDRIVGWRDNFVYKLPSGELVVIYDDLTEVKQAEEREKILQDELITQSRLATVGEMAAGIAHEINNPLTGVVGFAALLLNRDLPDDIRSEVNTIYEGAQRIASITSRMLAYARQQEPELVSVNINDVVENTLAMRSYQMKNSGFEVITEFDPSIPSLTIDATQIQQVFLNIILNAETEIRRSGIGNRLIVRTEAMERAIRVSFEDNGPGISEDVIGKIFNPFFTTRSVGEGTGLGLSVSYGIVKRHGGSITVSSVAGKGATFTVELPIITAVLKTASASARADIPRIAGIRALVVDDEEIVQKFLRDLLASEGLEVEICDTGEAALEQLKTHDYDVILLDIRLPGLSGIDVFNGIKDDIRKAESVIFITGDVMSEGIVTFIQENKVNSVNKPFDPDELLATISRVVHRHTQE